MLAFYLLLYVVSAVLFALSAFGVEVRRVDLLALGLFFLVLVPLLQTLQKL
jgi:hypothetical protein